MNIPTVPSGKLINDDGTGTPVFMNFLTQLLGSLQSGLSPAGIVLPKATSAQISLLNSAVGTMIFNSTTGRGMLNNSGTFQNIDVT